MKLYFFPSMFVFVALMLYFSTKNNYAWFAKPAHKLVIEMAANGDLLGIYEGDGFETNRRQLILDGDTFWYDVTVHLERFQKNQMSIYIPSYAGNSWYISTDKYGDIQSVSVDNGNFKTIFYYFCHEIFFIPREEFKGKKEFYPKAQKIFDAVIDDVTKSNK